MRQRFCLRTNQRQTSVRGAQSVPCKSLCRGSQDTGESTAELPRHQNQRQDAPFKIFVLALVFLADCSMKAVVAVKRVLDYAARVRVKSDKSGVDLDSVKMSMNPFCEIALEAALRLREAGHIHEVIAATVGDQAVLRHAYALGADRAIQVTATATEPMMVAEALSSLAQREGVQMLFLGKQAIDDLQVKQKQLHVMREIDEGQQELVLSLPAVVTSDLRLNTPRYASFKAVIASKKKKIEQVSAAQLGLTYTPQLQTVKVEEPEKRQSGQIVSSVPELVDFLQLQKAL